jgi:hypothetical protein
MKIEALAAGAASLFMFAGAAQATTYVGVRPIPGASVDLSITTDGVIGALAQSDITSWNISITDGAGSVDLTPGDSQLLLTGGLSATATTLSFDFSSNGLALFEEATIGDSGPFYCDNGNANCYGGGITAEGVATEYGESPIEQLSQTGQVVIATAGVPEPAAWAMMLVGFGAIGGLMRRRVSISAAA